MLATAVAAPEREAGTPNPSADAAVLNRYSRTVTQPKTQGGSQAMLYATGLSEEDMNKPQV